MPSRSAPARTAPPGQAPTAERLTIQQLATLSNLPVRTVRFYIGQKLVDRPHGERRGAWYDTRHLQQLLLVHRWRQSGLSLERIRQVQGGAPEDAPPLPVRPGVVEAWSRVTLGDGVEVHVEPHRAGMTPEQVRAFTLAVTQAYRAVRTPQVQGEAAVALAAPAKGARVRRRPTGH